MLISTSGKFKFDSERKIENCIVFPCALKKFGAKDRTKEIYCSFTFEKVWPK